MPKVLVITNDFPPRTGGIEVFVRELCDRFPPDQVVVLTAAAKGAAETDAALPYPVVRLSQPVFLATPLSARRAAAILTEHGCDRVLVGSSVPLGLLAGPLRAAGAERVVAMTHGHEVWWSRVPGARRVLRRVGDDVDVLTYVSGWCRDAIGRGLSAAGRARQRRLAPGVDPEEFRPGAGGPQVRRRLGLDPETPVVLSAARLVRRKGQDTLIEAWPTVRAAVPDARLVIVGQGPARRSLGRQVARLGLTDSIVWQPAVPHREMAAWYDAADVFAGPSRTRLGGLEPEALGIVFLEAAACAKPVLVGRSGGAPDTVDHGRTGYVVDPRSPAEIATRLVELLTDRELAAAMGKAGRERVVADWQWRDVAETVQEYLDMTAPVGEG